jgi:hypothetical protein
MHGRFYVCLPKKLARSRASVIRKVSGFLVAEGFIDRDRVWGGPADYFVIGGRWRGTLELLRLRDRDPKRFDAWWKAYTKARIETQAQSEKLFRKHFPGYTGRPPVYVGAACYGEHESEVDVMDAPLFNQLRGGFDGYSHGAWEPQEPSVVFTDGGPYGIRDEEIAREVIGRYWVAVIDYHF